MKVICFGDSNTWGYDPRSFLGDRYDRPWPEYLGELTGWEVVNAGSCGRRVPRQAVELPADADLVLVMLGTNDLLNGDEPEDIAVRMEEFFENPRTRPRGPDSPARPLPGRMGRLRRAGPPL